MKKNDNKTTIKLIASFPKAQTTYYHFVITHHNINYSYSQRFSKLCDIVNLLPPISTKFPSAQHLTQFVSSITGDTLFLKGRFDQMRRYFEAVSSQESLGLSLGLARMLQTAVMIDRAACEVENSDPKTPKIRGLKLKPRNIQVNDLFVLIP